MSSDALLGVVGAGNILMRDDGIGVRMVEAVSERFCGNDGSSDERVEFYDAGTAILELMPELSKHEVLLIVDALIGGEEPGAVYVLEREDLSQRVHDRPTKMSLHQVSLLEALEMAELEGIRHGRVRIMGIEPERVEPGMEFSKSLTAKLPDLVALLEREIRSLLDG